MKKICLIIFCFIFSYTLYGNSYIKLKDNTIIDSDTAFYGFSFARSISFFDKQDTKYLWLTKYYDYFIKGVEAASGLDIATDKYIESFKPFTEFKDNLKYFYYKMDFNGTYEDTRLYDFLNQKRAELEVSLLNGNQQLSAFYLGIISKYIFQNALWTYSMGKNSSLGEAKKNVIKEFINEINKLIKSPYLYKLMKNIKFDNYIEKNVTLPIIINNIRKYTALDSFSDNSYSKMNAIIMYNLLPMSDAFSKKVVLQKNIDTLSGEFSSYKDWDDKYINQLSRTFSYAINYTYEFLKSLPTIDLRPPLEISNLTAKSKNKRVVLHWSIKGKKEIKFQSVYLKYKKKWVKIAELEDSTRYYTVKNLVNGKDYEFKVTLTEPLRPESDGAIIKIKPIDNIKPDKVINFRAIAKNNNVILKWKYNYPQDISSFLLYIYDSKKKLIKNFPIAKNLRTIEIPNLKNNQKYRFVLTSLDKFYNESNPALAVAIPKDLTPPAPISNLIALGYNNTIDLRWILSKDVNEDVEKQIITLYNKNKKVLKKYTISSLVKHYTIENVLNDKTYTVGIKCHDEVPNYSQEVFVSVIPKLNLSIYSLDNKIEIENISPYVYYSDFDNDGYKDILVNNNGLLTIYKNKKTKFIPEYTNITISDNNNLVQLAAEKINFDNKLDIIVLENNKLNIYKQLYLKKFQKVTKFTGIPTNLKIKYFNLSDYDLDGKIDLILTTVSGEILFYKNNSNFGFTKTNAELNVSFNKKVENVIPFNYNGDKYDDYLVITKFKSNDNYFILENDQGKNMIVKDKILPYIQGKCFTCNIIDGSNILLTLRPNFIKNKNIRKYYLLNVTKKGIKDLTSKTNLFYSGYPSSITVGDYNLDKKNDIYMTFLSGKKYLFRNKGNYNFELEKNEPVSNRYDKNNYQTNFWDYDKDGDEDLVLIKDSKIIIYKNRINTGLKQTKNKVIFTGMFPNSINIK